MNDSRLLKGLVALQWIAGLVAVDTDIALQSTLPAEVRDYLAEQANAPWNPLDYGLALWSGLSVVAAIGLLLSQTWARSLYVVASVGNVVLSPLGPISIAVAAAEPFYQASILANGAALGVLGTQGLSAPGSESRTTDS